MQKVMFKPFRTYSSSEEVDHNSTVWWTDFSRDGSMHPRQEGHVQGRPVLYRQECSRIVRLRPISVSTAPSTKSPTLGNFVVPLGRKSDGRGAGSCCWCGLLPMAALCWPRTELTCYGVRPRSNKQNSQGSRHFRRAYMSPESMAAYKALSFHVDMALTANAEAIEIPSLAVSGILD